MSLNIVLIEPEIPQNTGNIARTCAVLGANLHLIRPLGFSVNDKYLKRAGLDYWKLLDITYYDDFNDFRKKNINGDFVFATTKAKKTYAEIKCNLESFVIFGSETRGISENILKEYKDSCIRIPMIDEARSLNLSNAVAILAYDIYKQNGFRTLKIYADNDILE